MLTNLLSEGQSSRLYKELVDNKKVALYSGSFPMTLEDPGLFVTFSIAAVGKSAPENEEAMDKEIERVKNELISDDEFTKLRNQAETDLVKEKSHQQGIAESLAQYYIFFKNTNLINTEIEKYLAVTKEDIKRVANKYFSKENRTVLYYLPKGAK
jgi:predicted Zn-dependent peptidase